MKEKVKEIGFLEREKGVWICAYFLTKVFLEVDLNLNKCYIKNFEGIMGGREKEITFQEVQDAHDFLSENEWMVGQAEGAIERNDRYIENLMEDKYFEIKCLVDIGGGNEIPIEKEEYLEYSTDAYKGRENKIKKMNISEKDKEIYRELFRGSLLWDYKTKRRWDKSLEENIEKLSKEGEEESNTLKMIISDLRTNKEIIDMMIMKLENPVIGNQEKALYLRVMYEMDLKKEKKGD